MNIEEYRKAIHVDGDVLVFLEKLKADMKADSRTVDIRPLANALWELICLLDDGKIDGKQFRNYVFLIQFELANYTGAMIEMLQPFEQKLHRLTK